MQNLLSVNTEFLVPELPPVTLHTRCGQRALPQLCLQLMLWFQPPFHHILCLPVTGLMLIWLFSMYSK